MTSVSGMACMLVAISLYATREQLAFLLRSRPRHSLTRTGHGAIGSYEPEMNTKADENGPNRRPAGDRCEQKPTSN